MPVPITRPAARAVILTVVALAVLAALLAPAGCYRKVVEARGVGAATVDTEPPDNPHGDRLSTRRRISPLDRQAPPRD